MFNLYPFLIYMVITTFTPGPNNIMSMNNGLRYGYKKTLGFLIGIAVGFFLMLTLAGLLNVALVSLLPQVKLWLNILGVVYMVFLAIYILRSRPADENEPDKGGINSFWAGVGLQFLNLKGILYGITIFSMYIIPFTQKPLDVILFALGLAVVGFLAVTVWALGGDLFRHYLQKHYKVFNWVMAGLLIYIAVVSLLESLGVIA